MAAAVEDVLSARNGGAHAYSGHIVTKYGHGRDARLRRVGVTEAAHPVPDAASMRGTKRVLQRLAGADERTLVLCVLSGGGSALLCQPAPGLSLQDLREANEALLACGASIDEVNCLRKHTSSVKGGASRLVASPGQPSMGRCP